MNPRLLKAVALLEQARLAFCSMGVRAEIECLDYLEDVIRGRHDDNAQLLKWRGDALCAARYVINRAR